MQVIPVYLCPRARFWAVNTMVGKFKIAIVQQEGQFIFPFVIIKIINNFIFETYS